MDWLGIRKREKYNEIHLQMETWKETGLKTERKTNEDIIFPAALVQNVKFK